MPASAQQKKLSLLGPPCEITHALPSLSSDTMKISLQYLNLEWWKHMTHPFAKNHTVFPLPGSIDDPPINRKSYLAIEPCLQSSTLRDTKN